MSYLIVAAIAATMGYFWRGVMDKAKKAELNFTAVVDKVIDRFINHD